MPDLKISQLNELTDAADTDILAIVDDPSGSPETKYITKANLLNGYFGPASISLLTAGTAATYTVPAGIYRLRVTVVGAGGGGGGSDASVGNLGVSSGGGAGAYAIRIETTTPGATFTYTIGALGAGGTAGNNSGTAGGSTLWDEAGSLITCTGGLGGTSMAAGTAFAVTSGINTSTATGGDVNIPGSRPHRGYRFDSSTAYGTEGAVSPWGSFGITGVNSPGGAASGYGAGGGGTMSTVSQADQAGGAGAPGVIIVEEYN